jgi:hypothetical protein
MRDKDGIILENLYNKVAEKVKTNLKVKNESYSNHPFDIQVGEGGLNPREGAKDIDRASVIEVNGQKYMVSGIAGVTPEYKFQKAEPENAIGAGWNQTDSNLDIEVYTLQIQTMEFDPNIKDYRYVYDMNNNKVDKDELNNPEVVQAAVQEIEKRIIKHNYDNPELYDKEYDNDDPEDDRDWERD